MERPAEIVEFAAFLTQLKTRSGLSYGVLAKRLYLSQSTLHRYCNGEAVPTDYAPIERLARLCKANPDELVELHRRWILADAARRKPPPDPVVAQPPAAPGRQSTTSPVAQTPTTSPAAQPPAAEPAGQPSAESEAADDLPAEPVRAPRWSSLRVLIAASVAVVVIAACVLVARNLTSDAKPTTQPPPAPLTLTVDPAAWADPCSGVFLLNRVPKDVPPPPTLEPDAKVFFNALGGIPAESQRIQLTLQGKGAETVVLESLSVRVVQTGDRPPGSIFRNGDGCGGPVPTHEFTLDLDSEHPQLKPLAGQPAFPFKVTESDPEVFYITASTTKRDTYWYFDLAWSSGGRQGTVRIDDHGKPFRLVPAGVSPRWVYHLGDAWIEDPPQG
ncbi:helix-turn-helix domain-containing protein [Kribbella antibiotica]|uniref:helix-turn-helix domain-containing protein n=1 Tax=Kribbella antibiotica TaxID=190195 RepID=UPI00192DE7F9|nr:helix-turn-helix transcriptional regulator [Kribbella antibiotica]